MQHVRPHDGLHLWPAGGLTLVHVAREGVSEMKSARMGIYGERQNSKGEWVYPIIHVSCPCGMNKTFEFDEDVRARAFADVHAATHRRLGAREQR